MNRSSSPMETTVTNKSATSNWLIPVFTALTFATNYCLPMAGMPVLFKQISLDLNLNVVQIGSVWGIISFGSILVMPIGGILGDRIGHKRTIIIVGILGGILGALRGTANSFISLMTITFLWGLISGAVIPALNMMSSRAAPKNKQGLAQGMVGGGGALGMAIGSMISAPLLSSLLGGWRNVLFLYGGVSILISLIWWMGIKEPAPDHDRKSKPVSLKSTLTYLLRLKPLWIA
jgi:MFS transporter, ACS family, glucarate transporter